jgi:hypothetical protein
VERKALFGGGTSQNHKVKILKLNGKIRIKFRFCCKRAGLFLSHAPSYRVGYEYSRDHRNRTNFLYERDVKRP